jgi:uncharacterized phage protein (TIGR01671 family)
MNKEIKFRIWNIKNKSWYDVNVDYLLCQENERLNGIFTRNDLIFQQFTGSKDKNGKDIYEGDIITNDYVGEHTYKIAKVIWNKNSFIADCGSGIFNMAFTQKMIEGTVRVIGNIFENPELLK